MEKINKIVRNHHFLWSVASFSLVLMIILFNFSQMIIETKAYSSMLSNNKTNNQIVCLKNAVDEKNRLKKLTEKNNKIQKEKNQTKSLENKNQKYKDGMSDFFIKPVCGGTTTSLFGDMVDRTTAHIGHDWAVNIGTNVVAAADGVVEKAYLSESYGNNILLKHDNGFETRYAHLSQMYVKVGDYVNQNQTIGLSGNTGDSTGPHLHFEVIKKGKNVNPLYFLKK